MLLPRTEQPSATTAAKSHACITLKPGELIISRTAFIIAITICVFLTGLSLLATTTLAYREVHRRRQSREAKAWGRKSMYKNRISLARKQVDASFSSQYSGCLTNLHENPEMGSESPVELMHE